MYLESLWVQGFRALTEQRIDITAPVTAVEGGNGAGKTTLLDAVYFLASGKSCLGLTNAELIRDGESYFVVGGRYRTHDPVAGGSITHTSQAMFTTEGHRELRIDGTVYHGFIRLVGGLRVSQFNFNSLFLVKGMPSARRQFINLLIASCDRTYLEMLSAYSAVMTRKNALLRQSVSGVVDASLLDLFDEQITTLSTAIYAKRKSALAAVEQAMRHLIADGLFEPLSDVSILYDPRPISTGSIRALRDRELARHACLVGCHLDDFVLLRGKRQLRDTASLGEAKLVALLLTFAGAEYTRTVTGEYPVLLLDDLEGDLDSANLDRLMQLLGRFEQVFIASFDITRLGGGLRTTSIQL
ncbi:MAG TPA: DNA replication and repair protein RecF [Clostridia bacterium]|nr:DNA replication and repair protein RecF [Clostridia bacterium]